MKLNLNIELYKKSIRRRIARLWQSVHYAQAVLASWRNRYSGSAFFVVLLFLLALSIFILPAVQTKLEVHYTSEQIGGLIETFAHFCQAQDFLFSP